MGESKPHIYSYTQLSTCAECAFCYYLTRIEKVDSASNAFSESGTLIHDILDQWAKGLIKKEDMVKEYERRYSEEVVTKFPRMLAAKGYAEKAYNLGLRYFEEFDEFAGYKILASEERFMIDIQMPDGTTRPFTGVIDLILQDELTEEIIICDHKSKSLSSFKKEEDKMYRQQLMYAAYVKEAYGEWPSRLMFNLFKENGQKPERRFDKEQYDETMSWACSIIEKIENNDMLDWLECKNQDFFCENICSARKSCPNGIAKPYTKKTKT